MASKVNTSSEAFVRTEELSNSIRIYLCDRRLMPPRKGIFGTDISCWMLNDRDRSSLEELGDMEAIETLFFTLRMVYAKWLR